MAPRYKQNSIQEEGLQNHLDRTAHLHKGFGYKTWQDMKAVPRITVTQLALKFGVNRRTIYKWLNIESSNQAQPDDEPLEQHKQPISEP